MPEETRPLYHGARVQFEPGDEIPGRDGFVQFTPNLDAAIWGAELAAGERRGRIYVVEPTGEVEDDPNLTNMRFRGNPTKSFRARAPLRVIGELEAWTGHAPEVVRAMTERVARAAQDGIEPDD